MPTPLLLYLFNEANSGTTPTLVHDTSTGTAANATITYGASGAWASVGAGDGLSCAGTGRAVTGSLNGTKVQTAISGSLTATIELVIDSTGSSATFDTYFSLYNSSSSADLLEVTVNQSQGGLNVTIADAGTAAKAPVPASGLYVVHVVVDTSQASAADRVKVYVNGSFVSNTNNTSAAQNTAIDAGTTWPNIHQGLGTYFGGQFPNGTIYYAALYSAALTAGQVSANATALAANNDANPNASTPSNPVFFGGMGFGP